MPCFVAKVHHKFYAANRLDSQAAGVIPTTMGNNNLCLTFFLLLFKGAEMDGLALFAQNVSDIQDANMEPAMNHGLAIVKKDGVAFSVTRI